MNPFTFALGLPGPTGDALWWHAGRTVGDRNHPPAERVFHDATFVMVPKRSLLPETLEFLLRHYGPHLADHFRPLAETDHWVLYQRLAATKMTAVNAARDRQ